MTISHVSPSEPTSKINARPEQVFGAAVLLWLPIGLLFVSQSYWRQTTIMGREIAWAQVLVDHLPAWGLWIIATPLLAGLALNVQTGDRQDPWRALLAHGFAAAVLTFVVSLATYLWMHALRGHSMTIPSGLSGGMILWRSSLASQLLLYAGVQAAIALCLTARASRTGLPHPALGQPDPQAKANGPRQQLRWTTLRTNSADLVVRRHEIEWAEAAGDVVHVKVRGRRHVVRERFRSLCDRLEGDGLVRVHRSGLVNLDHVTHIEAQSGRDVCLRLDDGAVINVSRSRRDSLEQLIGRRLATNADNSTPKSTS